MNTKIVKYIFCCLINFWALSVSAQRQGDYTFGVTFQPSLYWKYNKTDNNNIPQSYLKDPNKFNGVALGVSMERFLSDKLGIGGEITYSKQRQDVKTLVATSINSDGSKNSFYTNNSFTQLNYIKMPLWLSYQLEIGYESDLFLKFIGGPQLSYNTHYHSEYTQYAFDPSEKKILYDQTINKIIREPLYSYQDFVNIGDGTHQIDEYETDRLYKRVDVGLMAGASIQKRIRGIYNISIGFRYELGLTNIENTRNEVNILDLTFGGAMGYPGLDRSATHNRRLVLDIGVSRIIE